MNKIDLLKMGMTIQCSVCNPFDNKTSIPQKENRSKDNKLENNPKKCLGNNSLLLELNSHYIENDALNNSEPCSQKDQ